VRSSIPCLTIFWACSIVYQHPRSLVPRGAGPHVSFAVRASGPRALVLVNGIPINGGFFGNVFWNHIPKENLERIEIVRGASSSLYGSYAMGGVVNFVTRAPTQSEGQVKVQAGQTYTYQVSVRYSDVLSNKALALGFNANYYESQGYFRLPEDRCTPVEERLGAPQQLCGGVRVNF
jgi:outer membrane cobalamin receptor